MTPLFIDVAPISTRPFLGLGVEADSYIYNQANRKNGVNEQDLKLVANRLRSLKPALARLFVETSWFAHLDNAGESEGSPDYIALVRQLALLKEAGASVNLVLFKPDPWVESDLESAVRAMIAGLAHLRDVEHTEHIRWLTLWNEPDYTFGHGSNLSNRIFGATPSPSSWGEYVRLNRLAYHLLRESGLSRTIKLVVADTVWGPLIRRERMELALEAFADLDVAYSYHSYSNEGEIRNEANPDYYYLGMEEEASRFRQLLGPERELVCWEFNTSGVAGFGTFFAGIGPKGEDRISSIKGAEEMADKVISSMSGGTDGLSLWCLHDMVFGNIETPRMMEFGLWRFKSQHWYPRPLYHYYAALVAAFRPGVRVHKVTSDVRGLKAIAAKAGGGGIMALLNTSANDLEVPVALQPDSWLLRIAPSHLPVTADSPLHMNRQAEPAGGLAWLKLEPSELMFVFWGGFRFGSETHQ